MFIIQTTRRTSPGVETTNKGVYTDSVKMIATKVVLRSVVEDLLNEVKSLGNNTAYAKERVESFPQHLEDWLELKQNFPIELNRWCDISFTIYRLFTDEFGMVRNTSEVMNFESLANYERLAKADKDIFDYFEKYTAFGITQLKFNEVSSSMINTGNKSQFNTKAHNEEWIKIIRNLHSSNHLLQYYPYKVNGERLTLQEICMFDGKQVAICQNEDDKTVLVHASSLDWTLGLV